MSKLGTQLHIGNLVEPKIGIKNRIHHKPAGALWSSTYTKGRSAWVEWCEKVDFRIPADGVWRGVLLEPHADAKILVIRNLFDLELLLNDYKWDVPISYMKLIDYEKLAQDFDALHLTEEGLNAVKRDMDHPIYEWDVESTCWFRKAFEIVGSVEIPVRQPGIYRKSDGPVLYQSQNETVSSRVRDFIPEAVEERKALSEVINRKERDSELER